MGTGSEKENRKQELDLMRVLAIFFVIFNHSAGYLLYDRFPSNSPAYWIYMAISILCNFAVPLFFMVSAVLLIPRKETLGRLFRHRILRIVLALLVFSAISYGQQVLLGNYPASIPNYVLTTFTTAENGAYWFLYSYLAYSLCLPFLRKMVTHLTEKELRYFILLFLLFDPVYKMVIYLAGRDVYQKCSSFDIDWMFTGFIIYAVTGYYLEYHVSRQGEQNRIKERNWIYLITLVGFLCTMGMVFLRCRVLGPDNGSEYFHLFKLLFAASAYLACRDLYGFLAKKGKQKERHSPVSFDKAIHYLGEQTFGIYLIHAILIRIPAVAGIYSFLAETCHINGMVSAFLYTLLVFLLSLGITAAVRLIPPIRKIL